MIHSGDVHHGHIESFSSVGGCFLFVLAEGSKSATYIEKKWARSARLRQAFDNERQVSWVTSSKGEIISLSTFYPPTFSDNVIAALQWVLEELPRIAARPLNHWRNACMKKIGVM
jgi:hypothetical protein